MKGAAAVALALSLAACGFHWAGSRQLPGQLSWVYIDIVTPFRVATPPIVAALRARLTRRGAVVTGSASAARTVLRLSDLDESREVLSVDPFGKTVEFKLTTRVRYELLEDDHIVVAPDVMIVSRDYSFNATQVLAKEAEEQRLQGYMQDELAELLLLRLEAQVNQSLSRPVAAPAAPAATPPRP
jgi:LPS-assembly lipoprotein